jgi:hypothetical protein
VLRTPAPLKGALGVMSTSTRPRLEAAIRVAFAPLLRAQEFKGAGRRFYRRHDRWIQIITIQGSRYGGAFAVNLGVHFSGAPDLVGEVLEPKDMNEAHCAFRRRLSETSSDRWWKHEATAESMLAAVESAASVYALYGSRYFEAACAALSRLTPEALADGAYDLQGFYGTKVGLGLALARIRKIEGNAGEARGFAAYALQHLGRATAFKKELEELAA